MLPLPRAAATRPAVTGEALIAARLLEYDHRIRTAPGSDPYYLYHNYGQKIAFLVSLNRKADAIASCRAAITAMPDWWRPQMIIAEIAGPDEAAKTEADFRAWVKKHPTFIHYWYLSRYYRERGETDKAIAMLQEAVKHSLADQDQDAVWVPDAYAFDAASFACQQRKPELVLKITQLWEQPRDEGYHNNNLHAFKAAAELALGKFEEADADVLKVKHAAKTQGLWAGQLDQLDHAVTTRDQTFVYAAGKSGSDWSLLPLAD